VAGVGKLGEAAVVVDDDLIGIFGNYIDKRGTVDGIADVLKQKQEEHLYIRDGTQSKLFLFHIPCRLKFVEE
jgi:hypothetical protein